MAQRIRIRVNGATRATVRAVALAALFVAGGGTALAQCERFPQHVDYQQTTGGIAPADVDADGDIDVILGGTTVRVLINDGSGAFNVRTAFAGPAARVAAGDLDGDGDIDVAGTGPGGLRVLLNDGSGVFTPPTLYGTQTLNSLVLTDVDGDGDLDAAGVRGGLVYIFANRADGTFDPPVTLETPGDNVCITAADLNNDGHIDLATANSSSSQVYILWNRGGKDGAFAPAQEHILGGSQTVCCIASADLNGDGLIDLAISCAADEGLKEPARVRVLINDKDGAFTEGPGAAAAGFPQMMAVGDVDGDGDIDVGVTTVVAQVTLVLLNRGDGTLEPGWSLSTRPYPTQVICAELDGDGRLDLVVTASQPFPPVGYVSVLLNAGCCRTDIDGDGAVTSTDVSELVNRYFEDQEAGTLRADFNGDGVSNSTDVSDFIGAWLAEVERGCV